MLKLIVLSLFNILLIHSKIFNPEEFLTIPRTRHILLLQWGKIWNNWKPLEITCPSIANCTYTRDKKKLKKADAVVFLGNYNLNKHKLPRRKHKNQLFIYQNLEAEIIMSNKDKKIFKKNFYNFTQTYSSNADFYKPYGGPWFHGEVREENKKYYISKFTTSPSKILKGKRGEIFWTVSHCDTLSKREKAVNALTKYINVDQYGKCNERKLNVSYLEKEYLNVVSEYYFYVALENRDCYEYITEKYWGRTLSNSIPIVAVRSIYNGVVPPNSIIAMDDFGSAKDMAKYLHFLIENPKEYLKYFDYRKDGWKLWNFDEKEYSYCQLCLFIQHALNDKTKKHYKYAEKQLAKRSRCLKDGYIAEKWNL
uniref:Fucosyltransferase n=1 Tax=Parastrongyloides trichosuri TaxID=131310 RepID=A0A0N4Z5L3_PARTI